MKTYKTKNFEYWFDNLCKHWVLYPIDNLGNRIEWDKNDNPIESSYFKNKKQLFQFINNNEK